MKSLGNSLDYIENGAILNILKNETGGSKQYVGYLICFDGQVEIDTRWVSLGDFLKIVPNITEELDRNHIYQLRYNSRTGMYESVIFQKINEHYDGFHNTFNLEVVDGLKVEDKNLFDSIIHLDAKINTIEEKPDYAYVIKVS